MHKIMVVDDMDIFLKPIAATLKREGFSVSCAANGRVALEQMLQDVPDLILLDISMPEMDGFTFLETIRANPTYQQIPVILLTAINETNYVKRAEELNAQEYLVKSYFSLDEMLEKIHKYLSAL